MFLTFCCDSLHVAQDEHKDKQRQPKKHNAPRLHTARRTVESTLPWKSAQNFTDEAHTRNYRSVFCIQAEQHVYWLVATANSARGFRATPAVRTVGAREPHCTVASLMFSLAAEPGPLEQVCHNEGEICGWAASSLKSWRGQPSSTSAQNRGEPEGVQELGMVVFAKSAGCQTLTKESCQLMHSK